MPIRIVAVDNQEVALVGLQTRFHGTDVRLVATATSAAVALKQVRKHKPDVVLLEVRVDDGDGLAVLEQIKLESPGPPVIMFSAYDEPAYRSRAYALGAAGYALKCEPLSRLIESVRKVAAGESLWTRVELERLTGSVKRDWGVAFSRREADVLEQISLGLTNKEIAAVLGIGYVTVKDHVHSILRKIGVKDRTQAALWVVRRAVS